MSDLISREDYCKNICVCCEDNCNKAICTIWKAPAVDAAPVVHGDWTPKETMIRHPWAFNYYCSACKLDANKLTPYCPNCGAKMDGGK